MDKKIVKRRPYIKEDDIRTRYDHGPVMTAIAMPK